jgi:hypothetical protein
MLLGGPEQTELGGQHAQAWRGTHSYPRTRLRWTHSRDAAGNSFSSMYGCHTVNS